MRHSKWYSLSKELSLFKHIDIRFHFMGGIVNEGKILLQQNQDYRESHIYVNQSDDGNHV